MVLWREDLDLSLGQVAHNGHEEATGALNTAFDIVLEQLIPQ
jgi:hypothetical protein